MKGEYDMWSAFGQSVNTYYVPLAEQVGADRVVDVAKRMGIKFRNPGEAEIAKDARGWGAFTLGVSASTPLDLASSYATLANDGVYCAPTPLLEVRDPAGLVLDLGKPQCARAISPDVARAALDAARCPVGDRSSYGRCRGATAGEVAGIVGKPVAGKTGTTDTDESATLVATTRQLAVAGYEATPDYPKYNRADHRHVNRAVAETLRDALAGRPAENFPAPSPVMAYGKDGPRPPKKPSSSPSPPRRR
jgi:membrane peptidoglycan carboxypeptidase